MKNIQSLFLHKRLRIFMLFMKKVDELDTLLIRGCHRNRFYVLKVERILNFPSTIRLLIHPDAICLVCSSWNKPIVRCCHITWRIFSVSVMFDNVITITWSRCWIRCNFNSLILYFLEIHLLRPTDWTDVGLAYPVCSVSEVVCWVL